jgi:hypothetical protein
VIVSLNCHMVTVTAQGVEPMNTTIAPERAGKASLPASSASGIGVPRERNTVQAARCQDRRFFLAMAILAAVWVFSSATPRPTTSSSVWRVRNSQLSSTSTLQYLLRIYFCMFCKRRLLPCIVPPSTDAWVGLCCPDSRYGRAAHSGSFLDRKTRSHDRLVPMPKSRQPSTSETVTPLPLSARWPSSRGRDRKRTSGSCSCLSTDA